MSDSSMLIKFVSLVALIAMFSIFLVQWDSNAPVVGGYSQVSATLSGDPRSGFPFPNTPSAPQTGSCQWWEITCIGADLASSVVYVGALIWFSLVWFFTAILWFFSLVFGLFTALISSASLTMNGMPPMIQTLLWVLVIPFLLLLLLSALRFFRGNEG